MATSTNFLGLTLPAKGEFVDSWNEPNNQNFQDLDTYIADIHASLVTGSGTSTWAALRGSLSSLAERLDVSINADGTIDVSGSSDILDIATSVYRGQFSGPKDRLNDSDRELYDAGQSIPNGRFTPIPTGGPLAGFPHGELDSGIALRSSNFPGTPAMPISSPRRPWSPGLMIGGDAALVSGTADGVVSISISTGPAVFNIDGYLFRIRETIVFDWDLLGAGAGEYVWLYVDRDEANYNTANFRYDGPGGGGVGAKDLRRLQFGADGVTSSSTFTSATALFNTIALGKVKEGDILVIESGSAAGDYVIDALDGGTPDTKLTIKGKFAADVSAVPWHIQDDAHPNVGAVVTDTDPFTQPPVVAGRVYFARVRNQSPAAPDQEVTFTRGGVYDSGWGSAAALIGGSPQTLEHNLGQYPSQVEVWVRASATDRAYQPMVQREVVTDSDPAEVKATLLFPSVRHHANFTNITIALLNASTTPAKPSALFTNSAGTDVLAGEIRVIARL